MCVHVDATVGLHTPSYARLSPRESVEGFPEGFLSSVLMERLSATATCTASESPARHIATCKLEAQTVGQRTSSAVDHDSNSEDAAATSV